MVSFGKIGKLTPLITVIIAVGILLGIGFMVLEEFQNNISTESGSANNETISALDNVTAQAVTNSGACGFNLFAVTTATNATGGEVISSGNYTTDASAGTIIATSDSSYIGEDWNVTYTYQYGTGACEGVNATIGAINEVPTWLGIIVILAIVGILLAIVFNVLPKAGEGIGFGVGASGEVAEI